MANVVIGNNAIDYLKNIEPTNYTSNVTDLASLVNIALNTLIGVGVSIAILSTIYSTIVYTLSKGDKNEVQKAWNTFIWGVIAAGFSLAAVGIKNGVLATVGVKDDFVKSQPAPAGGAAPPPAAAPVAPPPAAPPKAPPSPVLPPAPSI